MIYCFKCGTANRDGSRFCNECGERLATFISCPSCNFPNLSTARFCNGCGAKLGPETPGQVQVASNLEPTQTVAVELELEMEEPLESDVPTLGDASPDQLLQPSDLAATDPDETASLTSVEKEVLVATPEPEPDLLAFGSDTDSESIQIDDTFSEEFSVASLEEAPVAVLEEGPVASAAQLPSGVEESPEGIEPEEAEGKEELLPSWLEESEDVGGLPSTGPQGDHAEAHGGESASGAASSANAPGDGGIALAASLAATPRVSAPQAAPASFANAGADFQTVFALPWRGAAAALPVRTTGKNGWGREDRMEARSRWRLLDLILIFLIVCIVMFVVYMLATGSGSEAEGLGASLLRNITDVTSALTNR